MHRPGAGGLGTLLRVWEDAGQSGTLTVTLPEAMHARAVQPIDLRGRTLGRRIPVTDGGFTFELGAFQPASFRLQRQP